MKLSLAKNSILHALRASRFCWCMDQIGGSRRALIALPKTWPVLVIVAWNIRYAFQIGKKNIIHRSSSNCHKNYLLNGTSSVFFSKRKKKNFLCLPATKHHTWLVLTSSVFQGRLLKLPGLLAIHETGVLWLSFGI